MKRMAFLLCLLSFIPQAEAEELDIPSLIGMDLASAIEGFGAPQEVYAVRGEELRQDDVVFYYEQHFYLFWFRNRIWQVRLDGRYGDNFFKVSMGAAREEVLEAMGQPFKELDDSLIYNLEDRGYPVRLRFYFTHGQLDDFYCYRGDL